MDTKEERREMQMESKYQKRQLLAAARFSNRQDLLGALLEDGKYYTIAETEGLLENYLKGVI